MVRRLGPLLGLIGGGLAISGVVLSDISGLEAVSPAASADTVAAAVRNNLDQLRNGSTLLLLGLALLVWFMTYLPDRVAGASSAARWPARVAEIGGLITVALLALVAAYVRAVTHTPISGTDSIVVKGVVYLDWDYLRTLSPFVSASLLGVGFAGILGRTLPRPISAGTILLGLLPLALPPGLVTALYLVWVVALAAFVVIRPEPGQRGVPSPRVH